MADRLVRTLAAAQAAGREPQIALTGGSIAERILRQVADAHESASAPEVDWARIVFWWGDERFVPRADAERNEGQARAALLDRVPVDPSRVHPVPSSDDVPDAEAAAAAYAETMRTHGAGEFDLVLLGVGPDGHVASLFPGHPQVHVDDAIAVAVHDSPKPPPDRVSLTRPALNRAREVWFLVSGAEKADAVGRALSGAPVEEIPATGVRGREATRWLLDREAAAHLD